MKLSRLSILAVAALTCAAFAISCESDTSSLAPYWADGSDVDGAGLNGGDAHGDGGIGLEFALVPGSVLPVEGDVGAGGHVAERECRPVDVGADGTIVHDETPLLNGPAAGKCRQNEMNIKKFTRFSTIVNVFFGNRVDFF